MKWNVILLAFTLYLAGSCSSNGGTTQAGIEKSVENGNWRISLFMDSGKDKTAEYASYRFTFRSDQSIIAKNGSSSITGFWSISDKNPGDDSIHDLTFHIVFSSSSALESLSEDWEIIVESKKRIELSHVSGGNGGSDFLTFEKI